MKRIYTVRDIFNGGNGFCANSYHSHTVVRETEKTYFTKTGKAIRKNSESRHVFSTAKGAEDFLERKAEQTCKALEKSLGRAKQTLSRMRKEDCFREIDCDVLDRFGEVKL